MGRLVILSAIALCGCGLFPDVNDLSSPDAALAQDVTVPMDSAPEAAPEASPITDSGSDAADAADAADASDGATCTCSGLVSAYRFYDTNNLGHDYFGNNNMTTVYGTPTQSMFTPNGLGGHSLKLDGSSTVCIDTGFTFDSTSDHTLCWWSRPDALADRTNQFAQTCSYDTWTSNSGADYLWRINNCNGGTAADLDVPNVYTVGTWTQICQTYTAASKTRTVVVNGQTTQKHTVVDTVPILEGATSWCIGSYGTGGFWTGRIYLPLWFDRVLSDSEIQQVYATACCLP